jgi:RNA polymerase sigma-70 factor (ECF subfamily)
MLGAHDRADEATNDTMLAVWKGAKSFQFRSKVSTWIFGIAYRATLKTARRNRKERFHVDLEKGNSVVDDRVPGIETLFNRVEVMRALDRLPLDLRAVVELTYFQQLNYNEISEILDCPVGTVKSRMHTARAKLREHLS